MLTDPFIQTLTLFGANPMLNPKSESVERPKSLCLVGPSRTGKTSWARSIEPAAHIYICNQWNIDCWDDAAKLVVIDDVSVNYFPWKPILGCQLVFNATGKYRSARKCVGGKPCIYLVNPDMDPRRTLSGSEYDWLLVNVTFIEINAPLWGELPRPTP